MQLQNRYLRLYVTRLYGQLYVRYSVSYNRLAGDYTSTPCLFRHTSNGVAFTLVVDDFLVKYIGVHG